jgi:2-polyprenyl-6-methoxyphenol hydroxylase-like FAD-dependent oxidoreductase
MTPQRTGSPGVLILGAGIGGLTAALQLHRVGLRAQVFEAVEQFAPVGVGINILPHASQQLGELGLAPALSRAAVLTRESVFFNRFGQLVYREPAGREAGYADPQYSIHRADLHRILLEAVVDRLGEDAVLTGHRVLRVDQDDRRATVIARRRDGSTVTAPAEAVVAADGIRSVARAQLFPDEGPPRYSGVMMWRGVAVWPRILTGASMIRAGWLANGKMVIYPVRDDVDGQGGQLVNWVAEVETPQRVGRDWTQHGELADFGSYYADWHFDWCDVPALLASTATVLQYPMVDQDPLPRWSHGRLTLLGDAAHPMVPRGSNGAGQAILDARALADCLAGQPDDPVAALRAYDDVRRPATANVVLTNRANPPDAILREVYQRTGDRPFDRLEHVVTQEELRRISENYKRIAGFSHAALRPAAPDRR